LWHRLQPVCLSCRWKPRISIRGARLQACAKKAQAREGLQPRPCASGTAISGCAPTITIAATGKSDNGATALTLTPVAEVYPKVREEPACRPQVPAPVGIADSDSHQKGPAFRPFCGLRSGGLQAGVRVAASLPRHPFIANATAAPLKSHKVRHPSGPICFSGGGSESLAHGFVAGGSVTPSSVARLSIELTIAS
jgi:hypothetical protein